MASSTINRKSIREAVKHGKRVKGPDMATCAVALTAKLGLHPSCTRKVHEILIRLETEGWIRLVGDQLRPWNPQARETALQRRLAAHGPRRSKRDPEARARSRQRLGGLRGLRPVAA